MNSLVIQNSRAGARVWIASKNGSFSVSSFFKAILRNPRERSGVYSIWKLKDPPRVLVFGWLAPRKMIPTIVEERDDDSEWLPYVLEGRRIRGPSLAKL